MFQFTIKKSLNSLKFYFISIVGKPLVAFYEGDLEILRPILDKGPRSNFVGTNLDSFDAK
jgi:hypothetical protein